MRVLAESELLLSCVTDIVLRGWDKKRGEGWHLYVTRGADAQCDGKDEAVGRKSSKIVRIFPMRPRSLEKQRCRLGSLEARP